MNLRISLPKNMELFEELASSYENTGKEVSVCDFCETTYPSEWVERLDGMCPFCGQEHTDIEDCSDANAADCVAVASNGEVMPDVSADLAEGGLVDNEPITA